MRYNHLHLAAMGMILLGIGFIAIDVIRGNATVYLLVIFPVIVSSGILSFAGTALLFFGFVLFFFASMVSFTSYMQLEHEEPVEPTEDFIYDVPHTETRYGGVIFIGPIPVVFGSDDRMARGMMYMALIIAIILLIAFLL